MIQILLTFSLYDCVKRVCVQTDNIVSVTAGARLVFESR